MARYTVHVSTPKPADKAFAYMADLRNFAEWDPGVKEVAQIHGDGGGAGATFDVTVKGFLKDLILRYRTTNFEPSTNLVARAESKLVTSLDTITVTTTDHGSIVTYDAELTLNGPLKFADSVLGLAFGRIGDRAAKGLIAALDGKRVEGGRR
jgi:polyketide cyclase/dehydrase/lipid transport protein